MRYFVTGASGWIGSAVVAELIEAGHEVVGLARSDASAERVRALGADVHRGELDDLDSLVAGAAASDGVVHLGYNHDFSRMGEAAQTDLAAINAIGGALEGHRPAAADRLRHARPRDRPGRDRGRLRRPQLTPADRGCAGGAGLGGPRRAVDRGALRADGARPGRPGLRRGAGGEGAGDGRRRLRRRRRQPLARGPPARRRPARAAGRRGRAGRRRWCTRRPRKASRPCGSPRRSRGRSASRRRPSRPSTSTGSGRSSPRTSRPPAPARERCSGGSRGSRG